MRLLPPCRTMLPHQGGCGLTWMPYVVGNTKVPALAEIKAAAEEAMSEGCGKKGLILSESPRYLAWW